MAKILVTGVGGFVGKHLARELRRRGHEVTGVGLHPSPAASIAGLLDGYFSCDLTDAEQVAKLPLAGIDGVIGLAGLAQVGASFSDPEKYKHVNVLVFSSLAERIIREKLPVRVLTVSTGAVYESKQSLPLNEASALTASGSPYAQSKILMEEKAAELRKKGLDCLVVRPFNHIGPGQEKGFLVPDMFDKIKGALQNDKSMKVGNLGTKRDYTDVRDVVRAYADLIELDKPRHDTYNVCSGHSVSGHEIVSLLLKAMGAEGQVEPKADPQLIRPDDPAELYGSHERLAAETGWAPKIQLQRTIIDFVEAQKV